MDPNDFIDLRTGQPREPRRQLPMRRILRWASAIAVVGVVVVSVMSNHWITTLILGGLVLEFYGGLALAWGPLIAWADSDRQGLEPSWLGRQLGSPWVKVGGEHPVAEHVEGVALLAAGFALQIAAGVLAALGY